MWSIIVRGLATGFGAGLLRPGPGTWGTLVGVPFVMFLYRAPDLTYMIATIATILFSIGIAELYELQGWGHDQKEVVIDEIAGFVVAMTWLPYTWQSFVGGFLLFRLFDIWKPWPIRYIDQRVRGGIGVVLDDVAAGIISNIILQVVYNKTAWLGEQYMLNGLIRS